MKITEGLIKKVAGIISVGLGINVLFHIFVTDGIEQYINSPTFAVLVGMGLVLIGIKIIKLKGSDY